MKKTYKYCILDGKKCKKLTHSQIKKYCHIYSNQPKPVITILLGAGAARIWGAPSTEDINKLFKEDQYFISSDGRTVGNNFSKNRGVLRKRKICKL